jgi:hypothetical protein
MIPRGVLAILSRHCRRWFTTGSPNTRLRRAGMRLPLSRKPLGSR